MAVVWAPPCEAQCHPVWSNRAQIKYFSEIWHSPNGQNLKSDPSSEAKKANFIFWQHFLKYGFQTLRIWKMHQILEWQRLPQNLLYAPFKIWNLINLLGATQNLPMVRIKFWWNLKSATGPHKIWKMHEDFEKQHLNQNLVRGGWTFPKSEIW